MRRPSPPELDGQIDYVMIEHVVYSDNAPWPADADGEGGWADTLAQTTDQAVLAKIFGSPEGYALWS